MPYNRSLHKRLFVLLFTLAGLLNWTMLPAPSKARAFTAMDAATAPEPPLNPMVSETAQARVRAAYGELPMRFESNQGQFDARVKFAARGAGYALLLTADEALMSLRSGDRNASAAAATRGEFDQKNQPEPAREAKAAVIRMKLVNANRAASVHGEEPLPGRSNYFVGNDPAKWRTDVSNYTSVVYTSVYRGVDVVYYGNGRELEYDFKVAAGADPAAIDLCFDGAKRLRLDAAGELMIDTGAGEVRQHKPLAYQEAEGKRRKVSARYVLHGNHQVSFALGRYDRRKPLVIDPVLSYSTYLGGSGGDEGHAIAVDAAGNAYITGFTTSFDFPTAAPLQSMSADGLDAFVTKLNAAGTALIYSTYLGGDNTDIANGIAVDTAGNAYVTGLTLSSNFPTVNALQMALASPFKTDGFVTKLNAAGTALTYSTYLGGNGNDQGQSIAADATGNAYVAGFTSSTNFPTANALQPAPGGSNDSFVTKLNPTGTAFIYSTYLGGTGSESKAAVAIDAAGNAYVAGSTLSPDFPLMNALQPVFKGKTAFKTIDGANNWAAINNGLPVYTSVTALAINPQTPSTLYAGTAAKGVYKSTNGGNNWSDASTGLVPNSQINALAINPTMPSTLFAGTASGIFRSTDGGANWSDGHVGSSVLSVAIDPVNPAIVYAGRISSNISKSTDGGQTWTTLQVRDNAIFANSIHALAVDPISPSTLYAGGDQWVFKSTDGGQTWQIKPFSPRTINVIIIDPTNPATVYAGLGSGIFKSTNGGDSWNHPASYPFVNTRALALNPASPSTMYAAPDGLGVLKSTNGGGSWTAMRNGLRNSFVNALAVDPQNTSTVYAGTLAASEGFIAKLNAAGSALTYSTYLGGDDPDFCVGIAVDAAGNAYVTGETSSSDFPTLNPLRGYSGSFPDIFITKLNSAGTALVYSTYYGGNGNDFAGGIAVDTAGNASITGTTFSTDLPLVAPLKSALNDLDSDAFVARLNASGTAFIYSTYFGGSATSPYFQGTDAGNAIAVDAAGSAYITGSTQADNFPTTPGAFQVALRSQNPAAFVSKISLYNVCLQDESNGNLLQFDSTSGAYQFTTCGGLTLSGIGTLMQRGCTITLQDVRGDRRLLASYDSCAHRGSASVQATARGMTFTITDRNTTNDTCACSR